MLKEKKSERKRYNKAKLKNGKDFLEKVGLLRERGWKKVLVQTTEQWYILSGSFGETPETPSVMQSVHLWHYR